MGNAIVDIIARTSEDFVAEQGLVKGSMLLIDEDRAHELTNLIDAEVEASGGSVANTMAGIASFGGSAAFIGKVSDDRLGRVFGQDMRQLGVNFDVPTSAEGPATGRSLILVTPDAQRTLNTFLGVASLLEPDDVLSSTVAGGEILFCEGYLWDIDCSKDAIRKAMKVSSESGNKVALTLSDTFCVDRHHQEFIDLVDGPVDILFANENELMHLYTCELDEAVEQLRGRVELGCVTRGAKGSWLVTADQTIDIAPENVGPVVDTTGAGDQYAAGVLYGLSHGLDLAQCGRIGSLAAAEVISHIGPRPERSLSDYLG